MLWKHQYTHQLYFYWSTQHKRCLLEQEFDISSWHFVLIQGSFCGSNQTYCINIRNMILPVVKYFLYLTFCFIVCSCFIYHLYWPLSLRFDWALLCYFLLSIPCIMIATLFPSLRVTWVNSQTGATAAFSHKQLSFIFLFFHFTSHTVAMPMVTMLFERN